jgi:hypothetical protein
MRSTRRYDGWLVPWIIVLAAVLMASPAQAQTCAPPPPGMIAWWPGDANAHDIVAGNHGTMLNGATFGPGLVGPAFQLDGINDFVNVPHDEGLNVGTGDFTVDLWVNFSSTAGEQVLIEKYVEVTLDPQPWPERNGWCLTKLADNRILFVGSPAFHNREFTVPIIPTQTWVLVALTRSGSTLTLYWNGQLLQSVDYAVTDLSSDVSLKLGHRGSPEDTPGSTDPRGFYLNGLIDEVELYDRALTPTEIAELFATGNHGKCKTETVEVDIKPGSFPNSINPRNEGVIPVAILTTPEFDASEVDASTCRFGPTGTEAAAQHWALKDVDADGDIDLVLQFPTRSTALPCGAASAKLTGSTFAGQSIQGVDSVRTVGCK